MKINQLYINGKTYDISDKQLENILIISDDEVILKTKKGIEFLKSTENRNIIGNNQKDLVLVSKSGKIKFGNSETSNTEFDFTKVVGKPTDKGGEIFNDYINNSAGANYSHVEGQNNTATGNASHAEGIGNKVTGSNAHAEGQQNKVIGQAAHAEGSFNQTTKNNEHAEGKYNLSNNGSGTNNKTRHSIGIGSSDTDRRNAYEVMENGDIYIYGIGGYNGKNISEAKTIQEVLKDIIKVNKESIIFTNE